MHGIIFSELRKYVVAKLGGPDGWDSLTARAKLGDKLYLPTREYPDAEAAALVDAAASMTGADGDRILQDFGEFMVPDLLRLYGALLDPTWRTLDVIEHTEVTIHRVVRLRNPGARPPELRCTRPGPDEVTLLYSSARRMCGVAKGIARGLASHFGDTIDVAESSCMAAGAPECRIAIRLVRAGA